MEKPQPHQVPPKSSPWVPVAPQTLRQSLLWSAFAGSARVWLGTSGVEKKHAVFLGVFVGFFEEKTTLFDSVV